MTLYIIIFLMGNFEILLLNSSCVKRLFFNSIGILRDNINGTIYLPVVYEEQ